MAFKDLLLLLDTYPDPTPFEAVDQAVALSAQFGDALTAAAVHVEIPVRSNLIAERLLRLTGLAAQEEERSLTNARALFERVGQAAGQTPIRASHLLLRAFLHDTAGRLAELARGRDLSIVPVASRNDGQRSLAETVIFDSGRPVVVFEAGPKSRMPSRLARIVIAWDGSRSASRAVADAMPILTQAAEVRILTVLNEKESAQTGVGADLRRHLGLHGVDAVIDEVDVGGLPIGPILRRRLAEQDADLLVMGAFGHSRAREFILGGATHGMIEEPPIPVFLSH